ncbi:hypothetical protein [Sphingobacterium psychroaquaticum]|nr:hypothetical protein [Sphingobacterium psychroaquaticum]
MKRTLTLGLFLSLLTFLYTGCSKDDDANGEVQENYFKVKVDGTEKIFPIVEARWVDGGNYLSIYGMNSGKESVTVTVMSEKTRVPAGQYSLDDASGYTILSAHIVSSSNGQLNAAATRGTVSTDDAFDLKITKIDNGQVQGSFTGTLIRVEGLNTIGKVVLTDGQFKASIKPN